MQDLDYLMGVDLLNIKETLINVGRSVSRGVCFVSSPDHIIIINIYVYEGCVIDTFYSMIQ